MTLLHTWHYCAHDIIAHMTLSRIYILHTWFHMGWQLSTQSKIQTHVSIFLKVELSP